MQYYFNPSKKTTVAHIWNAGDTACKMLSTGGISARNKVVTPDSQGRPVCLMCRNNADKIRLEHLLSNPRA